MRISLTIDNGPDPAVTPRVLDTLAAHEVRASFFVVGRQLFGSVARDLLQRMRGEGHRIGNHSFTHSIAYGELADPVVAIDEIERTQEMIGEFADPDRLLRPTGNSGQLGKHLLSRAVYDYLRRERYSCVLWNSIPRDWIDAEGWVDTALTQIRAQDWSVVVIHDVYPQPMRHLDDFLRRAKDLGAEFTEELPESCVPLLRGEVRADMSAYVTRAC